MKKYMKPKITIVDLCVEQAVLQVCRVENGLWIGPVEDFGTYCSATGGATGLWVACHDGAKTTQTVDVNGQSGPNETPGS
ncbi:MAG: hypothetical protein PHQ52_01805 [Candidatus Omnitrophica bacterium]|nr:hypothetical protein [Candidatus Omnitrophota bacterium]